MRTLLTRLFAALLLGSALLAPAPAFAAVDINNASAAELETLPGIGPSKAAAIVQYRTEHGPFTSVDGLDAVSGIGPATLASLRDQVTVGKPGTKAAGDAAPAPAPAAAPAGTSKPPPAAAPAGSSKAPPAGTTATGASSGASAAGCPVNINKVDAAGLQDLPGIGASKAAAILQYRVDHGPFASCDALDDVSGIGAATLAGLRDCCVVK
jgi:competence protein ComEA